jgi:nicotinate dehydrogenase subunit B
MSQDMNLGLSRRQFGAGAGALLASFVIPSGGARGQVVEALAPLSFVKNRRLEGWIRLGHDGMVTVFTGKAELGQGIQTALAQIVAEELDVPIEMVRVFGPDTTQGPDEGYTYGSQSIEQSGSAVRAASAQARSVLVNAASQQLGVPPESLTVENGVVHAKNGSSITYSGLSSSDPELLVRDVALGAKPKLFNSYKIVGKPTQRIDLPRQVTGQANYVQDMRLPGMLFGRIVRPPGFGASLVSFDEAAVRAMPGVAVVVRDGSFLGVVAAREEQAINARQALIAGATWNNDGPRLPNATQLKEALKTFEKEDKLVDEAGAVEAAQVHQFVKASYSRPYLSHASIGPSCAVALFKDGRMTVWSHTQGTFPLRGDLATVLNLPNSAVDVIHVPGSGCYGHNGADDVALDAALLARSVGGRPVKLQWMRDDEFGWAPISPAMVMEAAAGLSKEGKIVDWQYELWSNSHAMRPGQPGGINLLASWHTTNPRHVTPPLNIPQPSGNGDRNSVPLYDLPKRKIVNHLLTEMPIRTSSLRTLGGHGNIFAIECFMDELALAAGQDPIEFRLSHLKDPRGRAVIEAVAKKIGWVRNAKGDGRRGRGFAYTRYKNISTYAAVAVDVEVDRRTGNVNILGVISAVDVGQIINPDGVVAQTEGGIVQGLSWALKESVKFDQHMVTSIDWITYPIMTFQEVPPIDVILIDHPELPSLGAGEGSVGPASAALANAVANATGRRIRDLPLTPERVKASLV